MIEIRRVRADELDEVGAQTAAAYVDLLGEQDAYLERLRDAAGRAEQAELVVGLVDGQLAGSVTLADPGTPFADIARPGELEFRMLAVAPVGRGHGVGTALVEHVLDTARRRDRSAVVMSTQPNMVAARRIYDRAGFVPDPDRYWQPVDGLTLEVLVRVLDRPGADGL
ncbi:GNAT family N-acetyltransferase [Rhodococcus sp. D2-41]|uniref:GNAT family N-acetyltransferase n=1 Tax=Speluncibacter jeojiensis TaxID=2710754 RepID=A0A9X4M590_9ACTN|nr:GNAT family N-acetyltransferase [Rhodococcus sp. D2-41]MDG3012783.1 GNAT family N-acetyltransferase [Rhodococcus sp. D2-41]MDG3017245.1 GNAT family N-acetyltransferase [Corynebacteriales bacterium D3-21]